MSVQYSIDGQEWRETRSRDVSPTGIFLQSKEPVKPGQIVNLKFKLPNLRHVEPISAHAEVMRLKIHQGRQSGFGLQFLTLSADQYQIIGDFVRRVLGLPLVNGFQDAADQSTRGTYTFAMDRLARESAEKDAVEPPRQVVIQVSSRGKAFGPWVRRTLVILGIFGAVLMLFKAGTWMLDLVSQFTKLH